MKREAIQAIGTYMEDNKCDRTEAIRRLNSYKEGKTLAKLLDEYNYMRYTIGLEFSTEEKNPGAKLYESGFNSEKHSVRPKLNTGLLE